MKSLPKDPIMLLSYINTMLRDNYSSIEELCSDLEINQEDIRSILSSVGYEYEKEHNRFM